ncbi:MAG: hypothetical protein JWQ45_1709 [Blastococcus sp.]|jgi:hypothetical protein|nr:hypothetical protein [Blastococcus sp.]
MVTFAGEAADTPSVWWLWVIGGLAVWFVLAFAFAAVLGRSIRLADRRSPGPGASGVLTTADLEVGAGRQAAAVRVRRRALPLPPLGIALVVLSLGLETSGFLSRLTGGGGGSARLMSMDAPFSLPRMFVALLFAAAAAAAVAGAGSMPGRRGWWLAVGLVGGGIAAVKAGSTVHADALRVLSEQVGPSAAVLLSASVAAAVVAALWFLSRTERRDRRRVLSALALYAVASIGLSALSGIVANVYGGASSWAAGATFLEESGEALAAVAFLLGVLAGVAPRLVLPATWPLRRTADAHTLDLPVPVPGHSATDRPS